ncbi:hypothetical protein BVC80_1519g33 [Macleaya cordata]|uniref:B3 DNA binding domain n=1 Tax=Macleaya cordata TaxID=56857 RepID=A0A200PTG8_MACCD|nr:hypothetical protein BVC80_1519g33 [Macleaya cordata]
MATSTSSRPIVYYNFLLKKYQEEEEEEDEEQPVNFHDDGPWEIKKVLKKSDVGSLSRLLLSSDIVKKFIFPYWDSKLVEHVEKADDECCLKFMVRDFDTLTDHELIFKKWKSNKSYIFQGDWNSQFVNRRKLMENDEIGMFWNPKNSFFVFKLLNRANPSLLSSSSSPSTALKY